MESDFSLFNSLAITHRDIAYDLKDVSGLSVSGYRILLLIGNSKKGIRPTTIADKLKLKFSSVAAVVETLVQRDLVNRSDDPHDKRVAHLVITKEGAQLLIHIDETLMDRLKARRNPRNREQDETLLIDKGISHHPSEYVASVEVPYLDTETVLRKKGLSFTQFLILYQLELQGMQRPKDLSRQLDQKPATVSLAMNGLEKKSLISRSRPEKARSIMNIVLTEKGKELFLEAYHMVIDVLMSLTRSTDTDHTISESNVMSKLIADAEIEDNHS